MATFADIYDTGVVSTTVTASDGTVPPHGPHNTREYREWRGRNFSGTLVAKIAGPPRQLQVTLANYGITVTITEPAAAGADVTALSASRQTLSKYNAIVRCDDGGNALPGELPVTVIGRRFKGLTEVSSSATWSVGGAGSYSQSNYVFSFSSIPTSSTVYISSVHNGETLTEAFQMTKVIDATVPAVSGASTSSFSTSGTTFTGTMTTIYTSPAAFTKRATYGVTLAADGLFQVHSSSSDKTGTGYVKGKWQYSVDGSGIWTDAGTDAPTDMPCNYTAATSSGSDGLVRVTATPTGLVDATNYLFRVMLQIDTSGHTTMTTPFYVTALTGSIVT